MIIPSKVIAGRSPEQSPHENGFSLDHSSRDHELGCPFAVLHGNHRLKNPLEKNFEMPFMVTVQAGHD